MLCFNTNTLFKLHMHKCVVNLNGLDFLQDSLVGDFGHVSALDLSADTDQLLSDGILAGSIQHLLLDLGRIWCPNLTISC